MIPLRDLDIYFAKFLEWETEHVNQPSPPAWRMSAACSVDSHVGCHARLAPERPGAGGGGAANACRSSTNSLDCKTPSSHMRERSLVARWGSIPQHRQPSPQDLHCAEEFHIHRYRHRRNKRNQNRSPGMFCIESPSDREDQSLTRWCCQI